ncbi:hypothetical protein A7Q10_10685 [Methylacidiphilum caldifontis]|uniref:Uncharacterized protein n=1 Tax=Methylacidiphilum caldifontis TaxID=2795386 RepID=A0A4Y8PHF7_9BACT|nr:hypothetical protein A7Q10_10685 [Methylacidiphilum caldifontis]
MSGYLIALVPFVVVLLVTLADPSYLAPDFSSLRGEIIFGIEWVVIGIGIYVVQRMTDIRLESD